MKQVSHECDPLLSDAKVTPWHGIWGVTRRSHSGDDRSDTTTWWGIRYIQGIIVGDAWAVMQ